VLSRATGHLKRNREHLHVLGDGRDPFCPLTGAETGRIMRSTGEVARSDLEDGGGSFQWHSNSRNGSNIGGGGRGSSFRRRIGTGKFSKAARQRWLATMAARFWAKLTQDEALFIEIPR
jgi:hypothetical protein